MFIPCIFRGNFPGKYSPGKGGGSSFVMFTVHAGMRDTQMLLIVGRVCVTVRHFCFALFQKLVECWHRKP